MFKHELREVFFFLVWVALSSVLVLLPACTMLYDMPITVEKPIFDTDGKTIKGVVITRYGGRLYWFVLNSDATIDILDENKKVVGTVHIAKNDIVTAESLQKMVEKLLSSDVAVERIRAKNKVDIAKLSSSSGSSSSSNSDNTEIADGSDMDSAIDIKDSSIRYKPEATDGNLAVLTPSDQDEQIVKIWGKDGKLLDEMNYIGRTNGQRPTYRSNFSGLELSEESGGRVYLSFADKNDDGKENENSRVWYYAAEAIDYNK